MSAQSVELFLARLYSDRRFRARFLREPEAHALRAGLTAGEAASMAAIDRVGLELATASFGHKRRAKRLSWLQRLRRGLRLA